MNPFIWLTKAAGMIKALMAKPGGAKAVTEGLSRLKVTSMSAFTNMWRKAADIGSAAAHSIAVDRVKIFFASTVVAVLGNEAVSFALEHCSWDEEFIDWVKHFANGGSAPEPIGLPLPAVPTETRGTLPPIPLLSGNGANLPDLTGQFTTVAPLTAMRQLGANVASNCPSDIKERLDRVSLLSGVFGSVSVIPKVLDALAKTTMADITLYQQVYR